MEAISATSTDLFSSHVLVEAELADHVIEIVESCPGEKARCKEKDTMNLGYPCQFTVEKTFINIAIPSSMRSDADAGSRTASTTDADACKGSNPRLHKTSWHENLKPLSSTR